MVLDVASMFILGLKCHYQDCMAIHANIDGVNFILVLFSANAIGYVIT